VQLSNKDLPISEALLLVIRTGIPLSALLLFSDPISERRGVFVEKK
jgi:hypothetical protein